MCSSYTNMEVSMDTVTPGLFRYFFTDDGDKVPLREGYFSRHPSRLASIYMKPLILNIEGIIHYFTGAHQEALQLFEKALVLDPENLNSLENCAYAYENELNCPSKAEEVRQQIEAILGSENARMAQARCLAEQGRIYLKEISRMKDPLELLKQALVMAQSADDQIDREEVSCWKFMAACYALGMHDVNDPNQPSKRMQDDDYFSMIKQYR